MLLWLYISSSYTYGISTYCSLPVRFMFRAEICLCLRNGLASGLSIKGVACSESHYCCWRLSKFLYCFSAKQAATLQVAMPVSPHSPSPPLFLSCYLIRAPSPAPSANFLPSGCALLPAVHSMGPFLFLFIGCSMHVDDILSVAPSHWFRRHVCPCWHCSPTAPTSVLFQPPQHWLWEGCLLTWEKMVDV